MTNTMLPCESSMDTQDSGRAKKKHDICPGSDLSWAFKSRWISLSLIQGLGVWGEGDSVGAGDNPRPDFLLLPWQLWSRPLSSVTCISAYRHHARAFWSSHNTLV